jgi:hypothetical protein
MEWPDGHKFAFTVVDDTDSATLANVKPVYDLLAGLGMKTTKTAWMFRGEAPAKDCGATCEEQEYLDWLLSLQRQGFEIAFHNAAPCTSHKEITSLALTGFRQLFGTTPILFCNHESNGENMYWGDARLSGWRRVLYNLATRGKRRDSSCGHVDGDPLFWGDLCQQHVRYVRNFVFDELNALALCPEQPYHDPAKPHVNFWFTSADGGTVKRFLANFTTDKLKLLEDAKGLCIAYVHFAYGFVENGRVNPEFQKRLEYIAARNGWFAPASEVLNYLRRGGRPQERAMTLKRLRALERKWLLAKLIKGTS